MLDEVEAHLQQYSTQQATTGIEKPTDGQGEVNMRQDERPTTPPRTPQDTATASPPKTRRIDTDPDRVLQQRDAKAEAVTLSEAAREAWDTDVETTRREQREAGRPKIYEPKIPSPRTPPGHRYHRRKHRPRRLKDLTASFKRSTPSWTWGR